MSYEMLTGELPFDGGTSPTEIIAYHLNKAAPPPSQLAPDLNIPPVIDDLVLKMVAKASGDRHENAAALCKHIDAAENSFGSAALRRKRIRIAAVCGGVVALVGTLVALIGR
jgi:serine/threonine protein kinase